MKIIEAEQQVTFSDPFILPDGSFGCVEQFDNILADTHLFRAMNINKGEFFPQIEYNPRKHGWQGEIYYHPEGLVFASGSKGGGFKRLYNLLTGKNIKKKKPKNSDLVKVIKTQFAMSGDRAIFVPSFDEVAGMPIHVIAKIIKSVQEIKDNLLNSIIVSYANGNEVKAIEVGFTPKSVLLSPDGLTALAHTGSYSAIIDLE